MPWSATPTGTFISSADEIECEQVLRRGDEQPPPVGAAEGAVRHHRGGGHEAQLAPIRRPDVHAVGRTGPHPAARIDGEPVGIAVVGMAEEAPVGERAALPHIEGDDLVLPAGLMSGDLAERERGVGHVERRAIGREGEAIGLLEIRHPAQITGPRIETIQAAMIEFGLGQRTLVGHDDSESRIGEPDGAVGRDRDIVGRVEPPALVMGHEGLGLPVIVAAPADAAPTMLAVDQRAVRFDRVAVHEPGAVDQHLHAAIGIPAQQPPIGDVGPDQPIKRRLPRRSLAMECSLMKHQKRRIGQDHLRQPLVVDLDTRKIVHARGRPGMAQHMPRKKVGCRHVRLHSQSLGATGRAVVTSRPTSRGAATAGRLRGFVRVRERGRQAPTGTRHRACTP